MRPPQLLFLPLFSLSFALALLAQAPTGKIAKISIVHGGVNKTPVAAGGVSDDAVRAVMTEKVGDTYDPAVDQKDQRAVRDMGVFMRVVSAVSADPAGGVDITYTVVEAPIIQKVVIRANTPDSQPPVPAGILLGMVDTKLGQRLNMRTLRQDLNRLVNSRTGYLHQQGFVPDGNGYQIGIDRDTGTVTIRLMEARIAQIVVTGNQKVKTDDILRKMQSRAGDLLNLNTLQRDMGHLQDTGLFQSVGPYKFSTTDRQVRVTVPVVERANLAVAANPVLTPLAGEVRLEGTVRETIPGRMRLVLLAIRAQLPGRAAQEYDVPRPQEVIVGLATGLQPVDGERPILSAFQPGDTVVVIGKLLGPGKPLMAREIAAQ